VVCDNTRPPTGLGDRLTAFWGACLYAKLNNQTLKSLWRPYSSNDVHPRYNIRAMSFSEGCVFTTHFFGPVLQHVCSVSAQTCLGYSPECDEYINLVTTNPWRLAAWPSAVLSHVNFRVNDRESVAMYKQIAKETKFAYPYTTDPAIKGLAEYKATCVHLRANDKIVPSGFQNYVEVDEMEWQHLREWSLTYLKIIRPPFVFVIGDEQPRVELYEEDARHLGMRVLNYPLPSFAHYDRGAQALVDLQRLAACNEIVLVSKFSSFALTASLIGNGRLVIKGMADGTEHRMYWEELKTIQLY